MNAMVEEEEIPQEIIQREIPSDLFAQEILPRVPARHLQALKTVSKDWLQIITSPFFVKLHLSLANRNHPIRVLTTFSSSNSIVEYSTNNYEKTRRIPYPPQFSSSTTKFVGSADGLTCMLHYITGFHDEHCVFAILNPSTRKSYVLELWPPGSKHIHVHLLYWWFGSTVPGEGEYILVIGMVAPVACLEFAVFKFTSRGLERVHSVSVEMFHLQFDSSPLEARGTLVQGLVYWPAQYINAATRIPIANTIFAYHPEKNTLSEISPPAQCDFRLGAANGCLFATLKNMQGVFELWIMKECRWTKYGNINIEGRVLSPLGCFPNGDVVLDVDKTKLIKYNFYDRNKRHLILMEYDCPGYQAIMCDDTLVSPTPN